MASRHVFAAVAAAFSFVATTSAHGGEAATPALKQCVAERDDARRLACFDAEMARLEAQPPAAPLPTAEEKFGARGDLKRDIEQPAQSSERELDRLDGTVEAIALRPGGGLIVTLDNGQVWQQLATGERFRLEVGDKVTLKPGVLGSYFLVGPRNRSTKVKRIK
ncbi:MAG: hypothetical protein AB7P31_00140 [Steroidobacteraceae bacterium]